MNRTIFGGLMVACMALASTASAANNDPAPVIVEQRNPVRVGFGMDLGVPSGFGVGVVVHPGVDWLSTQLSLNGNYIGWGGRLALKFDPMALKRHLPIGVFLDLQGGFMGRGDIPGHDDLPSVGYDYFNTYLGLRLGTPNGFHWFFEAGPTYLHVNTDRFGSLVNNNNLSVGNPTLDGWFMPTFSTGFEVVWP